MPSMIPFSWRISPTASREHARRWQRLGIAPRVPHPFWETVPAGTSRSVDRQEASDEGTDSPATPSMTPAAQVSLNKTASHPEPNSAVDGGLRREPAMGLDDGPIRDELHRRIAPLEQAWLARGPGALAWCERVMARVEQRRLTQDSCSESRRPATDVALSAKCEVEPLVPYLGGYHGWNATRQVWQVEALLHDVSPRLPEWVRLLQVAIASRFAPRLLAPWGSVTSGDEGLDESPEDIQAESTTGLTPGQWALLDGFTLLAAEWVEATEFSDETVEEWESWSGRCVTSEGHEATAAKHLESWRQAMGEWRALPGHDLEAVADYLFRRTQ
ncbi:MAG: hypothetical protein KDA83_14980 [Planctomycetales bacterium]|nr:hypothetical protein [Planctomycetales bacterium]